jgi:hypothetical protein
LSTFLLLLLYALFIYLFFFPCLLVRVVYVYEPWFLITEPEMLNMRFSECLNPFAVVHFDILTVFVLKTLKPCKLCAVRFGFLIHFFQTFVFVLLDLKACKFNSHLLKVSTFTQFPHLRCLSICPSKLDLKSLLSVYSFTPSPTLSE